MDLLHDMADRADAVFNSPLTEAERAELLAMPVQEVYWLTQVCPLGSVKAHEIGEFYHQRLETSCR